MMNLSTETGLLNHEKSAALGQTVPVDHVPVGFMVLATCPLIFWLLDGTVAGVASALLIIGLFSIGLLCLSIGQRAHAAYNAAEYAYRPRIPFKLLGSAMVGLVVALLATAKIQIPSVPYLFGMAAFVLSILSFGLDPMRDKGLETPQARIRATNIAKFAQFERRLENVLETVEALGDPELTERVRVLTDTIMGLATSVDFETVLFQRMTKPLAKLISRIESLTEDLAESFDAEPSAVLAHKYVAKMTVLTDVFEQKARQNGIARGRDSFELHADLLFERMTRNR